IRDLYVTGVQTCALPICSPTGRRETWVSPNWLKKSIHPPASSEKTAYFCNVSVARGLSGQGRAALTNVLIMFQRGSRNESLGPQDRKSTRLNSSHVEISY